MQKLMVVLFLVSYMNTAYSAADRSVHKQKDSTEKLDSKNPYLVATFSATEWTATTRPVAPIDRNLNPAGNRYKITPEDVSRTITCNIGCCAICCCFGAAFAIKKILKFE